MFRSKMSKCLNKITFYYEYSASFITENFSLDWIGANEKEIKLQKYANSPVQLPHELKQSCPFFLAAIIV